LGETKNSRHHLDYQATTKKKPEAIERVLGGTNLGTREARPGRDVHPEVATHRNSYSRKTSQLGGTTRGPVRTTRDALLHGVGRRDLKDLRWPRATKKTGTKSLNWVVGVWPDSRMSRSGSAGWPGTGVGMADWPALSDCDWCCARSLAGFGSIMRSTGRPKKGPHQGSFRERPSTSIMSHGSGDRPDGPHTC